MKVRQMVLDFPDKIIPWSWSTRSADSAEVALVMAYQPVKAAGKSSF
tara:strand:- start:145 stop:285 length:141 start_codon:yes stop_codon:yes gene_type:complete